MLFSKISKEKETRKNAAEKAAEVATDFLQTCFYETLRIIYARG
jgi:hypothetical protein